VFPGFVVLKDDLVYRFPFSVFHFHIKPLPERLKGLVAAGFSLRFFPMFVWTVDAGVWSSWRLTRFSVFGFLHFPGNPITQGLSYSGLFCDSEPLQAEKNLSPISRNAMSF
jgi:hypothetical protein